MSKRSLCNIFNSYIQCTYTHTHKCALEMQRYIDVLAYHDTLGSGTVSIGYIHILIYRHQNVYLYTQLMLELYIMVVNFTALQLFIAYNFRKSSKNQLIYT